MVPAYGHLLAKREGLSTKKFPASRIYTALKHVKALKEAPRLFAIHVGTNDLATCSIQEILDGYDELTGEIRSRFPGSKIVLSCLVNRSDDEQLQNMIEYINACLTLEYENDPHIKVCKHPDIGLDSLWKDGIHLINSGTSRLASDLRAAIAKTLGVPLNKKKKE